MHTCNLGQQGIWDLAQVRPVAAQPNAYQGVINNMSLQRPQFHVNMDNSSADIETSFLPVQEVGGTLSGLWKKPYPFRNVNEPSFKNILDPKIALGKVIPIKGYLSGRNIQGSFSNNKEPRFNIIRNPTFPQTLLESVFRSIDLYTRNVGVMVSGEKGGRYEKAGAISIDVREQLKEERGIDCREK
ncbi:hypothetical protein QVD17_09236 [Tagetes erecta]|uniref:Uncharacterized protein n=1 Tax=Tagetes erecta TaxID=13708 RepID=A0AAD8L6Y5_TARER|nr:hypothetical protein QVD17_09236 [Tagetes erecta]